MAMNFKTCLNSVVSDYHTVLHCLVLSKLQEVSKHDTHPLLLARRQAWGWSKGYGTGCEISGAMTRSFLQGRSMVILLKGQKYWSNLIKRKSVIPSTQNPPKMILFLVLHASCCNCSMSGPRVLQLISWYWLQLSAVGQLLQWDRTLHAAEVHAVNVMSLHGLTRLFCSAACTDPALWAFSPTGEAQITEQLHRWGPRFPCFIPGCTLLGAFNTNISHGYNLFHLKNIFGFYNLIDVKV